jgi:hypothetical protein
MRAPIEEAATPLPREEHTPPVTKISFFMGLQYPGSARGCQLSLVDEDAGDAERYA